MSKVIPFLIAVFGSTLVAYGVWYHRQHPREIIKTGSLTIDPKRAGLTPVVARIRTVKVGAVLLNEIEMPNGTWIDCAGDCDQAYKAATTEFWDIRDRERGGK
jgi:hypothetical protein